MEQGLTFFTSHFQLHLNSKDTANECTQRNKQTYMAACTVIQHAYPYALTHRHTTLTPHTDAQGYTNINLLHIDAYKHLQAHAPQENTHELYPNTNKLKHTAVAALWETIFNPRKCPSKKNLGYCTILFPFQHGKKRRSKNSM